MRAARAATTTTVNHRPPEMQASGGERILNIHEVLEFGSVAFSDPVSDTLITINSAYLNWWSGEFQGAYTNTAVRRRSPSERHLTVSEARELARSWFEETRAQHSQQGRGEGRKPIVAVQSV
jgi:hypothetical protein